MAGQGSTIENGATGEVFTFRRTGGETNGESLVVEAVVRPGAAPPAAHAHPAAEERLQVVRARPVVPLRAVREASPVPGRD